MILHGIFANFSCGQVSQVSKRDDMTKQPSHLNPIIIIPARMESSRLPGKPLADIAGKPMIVHVLERAQSANLGPVYVACCDTEIADVVGAVGGQAVLTDPDLPSGTDRIRAALDLIDSPGDFDCVINVQGDLPTLDPAILAAGMAVLNQQPDCDIATLVVRTESEREIKDPNVVKAVLSPHNDHQDTDQGRALYFSRSAVPWGDGPVYHHIGIYFYRRAALERFCDLPPSPLERRERLEQLRALEAGMRIDAAIVDAAPDGVDTPEDLARARAMIEGRQGLG